MVFDFFPLQARKYWDKFVKTLHYFNVFIWEINVNYACESNKGALTVYSYSRCNLRQLVFCFWYVTVRFVWLQHQMNSWIIWSMQNHPTVYSPDWLIIIFMLNNNLKCSGAGVSCEYTALLSARSRSHWKFLIKVWLFVVVVLVYTIFSELLILSVSGFCDLTLIVQPFRLWITWVTMSCKKTGLLC